ncbi:MAG: hypothetical protein WCQ49_00020 [Candidatus Saccharibacteria bacterium]
MPSTTSILQNLKNNYPQFDFKPSDTFYWSFSDKSIYYDKDNKNDPLFLLHELSHAILGHNSYSQDIQLLVMERQAWDKTIELAKDYNIQIAEELIQLNLDSYRDWLHNRSKCPKCKENGIQINDKKYKCLVCGNTWLVNEARTCALRRYNLIK